MILQGSQRRRGRSQTSLARISALLALVGLLQSNVSSSRAFHVSAFVSSPSRGHGSTFCRFISLPTPSISLSTSCVETSALQSWAVLALQGRTCTSQATRTRLYDGSRVQSEVEYSSTETMSNGDHESHATNGRSAPSFRSASDGASIGVSVIRMSANGSHNGHTDSVHSTAVNGVNGGHNGKTVPSLTFPDSMKEIPMPTENGGFSHTTASRAKISAANKGKTPWNKGQSRSPEVKARIAAGVRAKNRERFLQSLIDMGVTEEEYEADKKKEASEKELERQARRTEKGGYRPTEETKQKISQIIKEKYKRGEVKARTVDPNKVRRNFTHSTETRARISASLRERWATDVDYREKMRNATHHAAASTGVRQRISDSLKKKWEDPAFRQEMMDKRLNSTGSGPRKRVVYDEEHRRRISEAMKSKWLEPEYRQRTMSAIAKRQDARERLPPKLKDPKPKQPRVKPRPSPVMVVKPLVPKVPKRSRMDGTSSHGTNSGDMDHDSDDYVAGVGQGSRASNPKNPQTKAATKRPRRDHDEDGFLGEATTFAMKAKTVPSKGTKKVSNAEKEESKKKEPDGSVNRLKEERRDLFDLLYGDDDEADDGGSAPPKRHFQLGDENLDTFDPYGLDDY
jgi:hypothetical protein